MVLAPHSVPIIHAPGADTSYIGVGGRKYLNVEDLAIDLDVLSQQLVLAIGN